MIKILTIIGARPQFIKAAAISRVIRELFSDSISETILHTGQHYDANMSQVFFKELGIPNPNYNLGVGSASHGMQTARIIQGIEDVLIKEHFDGIVLYGDTNSTLAGAIAASKLSVPIFHIEAGLRSFNMTMPEEINRIVCDQLSSILFAPTQTAINNLIDEGLASSSARFSQGRMRRVMNVGDVMYDNSIYYSEIAESSSRILEDYSVKPGGYILTTIHRDFNTDVPERINDIFTALSYISDNYSIPIILPLHPRTRKHLPDNISQGINIIPPASFFDILKLEKNAKIIMTDSGGLQKEAFFFSKPCVILRPETEWLEIVKNGAGILADADFNAIINAYEELSDKRIQFPPLFGDGHAAEKILSAILDFFEK